jgi:hypothetical protein
MSLALIGLLADLPDRQITDFLSSALCKKISVFT